MLTYGIIFIGIGILASILFLLYIQISSQAPPTTTNTTLKGRDGIVVKKINPDDISGKVKVVKSSQIWSATSNRKIEEGKKVRIKEVDGVHLNVKETVKINEETEEEAELLEDIDQQAICPNCDTVLTVHAEECPVCSEKLVTNREVEDKRFLKFFENKSSSSPKG